METFIVTVYLRLLYGISYTRLSDTLHSPWEAVNTVLHVILTVIKCTDLFYTSSGLTGHTVLHISPYQLPPDSHISTSTQYNHNFYPAELLTYRNTC